MFSSKSGDDIKNLWEGNTDCYAGDTSAADQALLCHLAFWTGKDPVQMERLFSQSELGHRDKWFDREDYRQRSISNAITTTSGSYKPASLPMDTILNDQQTRLLREKLRSLPTDMESFKLPKALEPFMDLLASIHQGQGHAFLTSDIKKYFSLSNKDIEPYVKYLKAKRKRLDKECHDKGIILEQARKALNSSEVIKKLHPAVDYLNGIMYFGVTISGQQFVVSSEQELLDNNTLESRNLALKYPTTNYSNFSPSAIHDYLDGKKIRPRQLFEKIRTYILHFICFTDPRQVTLITTWVLGTYLFPVFRHFPYLWINAEKGSGKTTLLEVLRPICFNGQMLVSPTPAVLFRDIETNRPTMLMDEIEGLTKQNKEASTGIQSVLNAGYNSEGAVKRNEGNSKGEYKMQSYSAYSP